MSTKAVNVGLFVTCLVDLFRPSIGFAAVQLLQKAGAKVHIPAAQTCCGQPAYNSGAKLQTKQIAQNVITAFKRFDYVVAPSGSCAAMISHHYPALFEGDPAWHRQALDLARRTFELTQFLSDVMGLQQVDVTYGKSVTYHDSCSGLREIQVKQQPRRLLQSISGLELREMSEAEACCGFGGTFCVKYADISVDIVDRKVTEIEATGAQTLAAGDLGCLMNMAGRLKRRGSAVEVRHVAEILAGLTDETPPIAGDKE